MSLLLDTSVVTELRRAPGRRDEGVATWAAQHPAESFFLSVVTALELELGILGLAGRDRPTAQLLRAWFEDRVLVPYRHRLLPVDLAVVRESVRLHAQRPRPDRDALIAGTALVHDLTVVTRNVGDFAGTGVRVVDPWEASGA